MKRVLLLCVLSVFAVPTICDRAMADYRGDLDDDDAGVPGSTSKKKDDGGCNVAQGAGATSFGLPLLLTIGALGLRRRQR